MIIYFISCSSQHFPACPGIASGMVPTNWYLSLESLRVWFQQIGTYPQIADWHYVVLLIRSPMAPSKIVDMGVPVSANQACLKAEHVDLPKSRNRHNDDGSGARRTAPKKPQPLRGVDIFYLCADFRHVLRASSFQSAEAELELINPCESGESVCCTLY
jgi:hypothetical protein